MPPPRRSNNFQDDWMKKEEFVEWLKPVRSCRDRAHCKLCLKNFDIGNMGISDVVSHMQSTKHKRHCNDQQQLASNPNSLNSLNFFATPSSAIPIAVTTSTCNTVPIAITARTSPVLVTATSDSSSPNISTSTTEARKGLASFLHKDDVTKAEIMWTLKTVVQLLVQFCYRLEWVASSHVPRRWDSWEVST